MKKIKGLIFNRYIVVKNMFKFEFANLANCVTANLEKDIPNDLVFS